MADDAILTLEKVVAGYGRMTILNGVSASIRRGAITTVIGPNGAGKSTLFKTVFGVLVMTMMALFPGGLVGLVMRLKLPSPVFGGGVGVIRRRRGNATEMVRHTPSGADYRATSPGGGGGRGTP